MTADLPEWAVEKARELLNQAASHGVYGLAATTLVATALVSVAKAERERAAGICRRIDEECGMEAGLAASCATAILADGGKPDG